MCLIVVPNLALANGEETTTEYSANAWIRTVIAVIGGVIAVLGIVLAFKNATALSDVGVSGEPDFVHHAFVESPLEPGECRRPIDQRQVEHAWWKPAVQEELREGFIWGRYEGVKFLKLARCTNKIGRNIGLRRELCISAEEHRLDENWKQTAMAPVVAAQKMTQEIPPSLHLSSRM